MMTEEILERIRETDGVRSVHLMDEPAWFGLELEEHNASGPVKYENRGLTECRSRDLRICVFSDGFLERPTEVSLVMTDDLGTVIGHEVVEGAPGGSVREGGVMLTESFVMYPALSCGSNVKFEILPHGVPFLERMPGVRDVTSFNPSRNAHMFLADRFRYDGPKDSTSTVIALNIDERCPNCLKKLNNSESCY